MQYVIRMDKCAHMPYARTMDNTTKKPSKRRPGPRPVIHPDYAVRPTDRQLALREARNREYERHGGNYDAFQRERIAAAKSEPARTPIAEPVPGVEAVEVPESLGIDYAKLKPIHKSNYTCWVFSPRDGWALQVTRFVDTGVFKWRVMRGTFESSSGREMCLADAMREAEASYLRMARALARFRQL